MIDIKFTRDLAVYIVRTEKHAVTIRVADQEHTLREGDVFTYNVNLEYHE